MMLSTLRHRLALPLCCALLALGATQPSQAAEKKKFTATAKSYWYAFENLATPAEPTDVLVYRAPRRYFGEVVTEGGGGDKPRRSTTAP